MANSLETRALFLIIIVEFAWELPIEFKFRNGLTKAPLREILSSYIPKHLIDIQKWDFQFRLRMVTRRFTRLGRRIIEQGAPQQRVTLIQPNKSYLVRAFIETL